MKRLRGYLEACPVDVVSIALVLYEALISEDQETIDVRGQLAHGSVV